MIASNGNGSLTFGNYTYDPAGAITAIGGDTYRYDKVGRLVSGTALGGTKTQTFTYDTYGNLTSITKGTVTSPLSVDAATNHISSPATYDVAGNLTAYGVYGYSWDAGGMLSRTSNGTSLFRYVYTADDERIGMEEISTYGTSTLDRWTWSVRDLDGQVLRVFTSSGGAIGRDSWSWSEDYVYGPGGILATESAQGRRHFHLDHLGTPRMITDGGGFKLSRHDYYAFGEEASGVSQDAEVRKFTGHERDMLSGNVTSGDSFDYMHARYYAPLNGRFLSPDPIEGDPGNPQSWNRYTYVLDDPIVFYDPTGLAEAESNEKDQNGNECPKGSEGPCVTATGKVPKYDEKTEMFREFRRFLANGEQLRRGAELINRRSASAPGWIIAAFSEWRGVRDTDTFVFQNDWWLSVIGAQGVTFGNVVIVNKNGLSDARTLLHESKHVEQYSRQGLLFYPDYASQYLFNWIAMGDRYAGYRVISQELEANR
ncbi:MAG: RHS repeat-associated core domain-containing protein [Acidobacteriota bacterium]